MPWGSWVNKLLPICVLTFSQYSSFEITANLEPLSWTLPQEFCQVLISVRASISVSVMLWNTLVLTFFGWKILRSIFFINALKQWQLVVLARKLAVLTTFFGSGSSNHCSSLLIKCSVEDWLEFWSWKRSLLTKLSKSCLKLYQSISSGVGTILGPLDKRDLQASESSILVRLMAFWSGPFNLAVEIITFLLCNQSFFVSLSCLYVLDSLNLLFLHLDSKVLR